MSVRLCELKQTNERINGKSSLNRSDTTGQQDEGGEGIRWEEEERVETNPESCIEQGE